MGFNCFCVKDRDRRVAGNKRGEYKMSRHYHRQKGPGTKFYCCGSIPPSGLYRERHVMLGKCISDGKPLQIEKAYDAFEVDEDNFGFTIIEKPDLPHIAKLPEPLYQGRAIEIGGHVLLNAERFCINLSTDMLEDADVGFHFNPRLHARYVVRNHNVRGHWGEEERAAVHSFPFTRGKPFNIVIYVADEQFLVAVNGRHFCAFTFRVPVEELQFLIVTGDISLQIVKHFDMMVYPVTSVDTKTLSVQLSPVCQQTECQIRRKIDCIDVGSTVEIVGKVKLMPQSFYINLQAGSELWPHPLIPLHINPRYHSPNSVIEEEVIFNSWLVNSWGAEEKLTNNPFTPGTPFHLLIACTQESYIIKVNDEVLYRYTRRSDIKCDALVVHGDVLVSEVSVFR